MLSSHDRVYLWSFSFFFQDRRTGLKNERHKTWIQLEQVSSENFDDVSVNSWKEIYDATKSNDVNSKAQEVRSSAIPVSINCCPNNWGDQDSPEIICSTIDNILPSELPSTPKYPSETSSTPEIIFSTDNNKI